MILQYRLRNIFETVQIYNAKLSISAKHSPSQKMFSQCSLSADRLAPAIILMSDFEMVFFIKDTKYQQ